MSPAGAPSEDILRQFLSFLKFDRTLSDNTVLSYGRDVAKYFRFLESERTAWDRAREADLAHVARVEHARLLARRDVLLDDRGVLKRHAPGPEGRHLRARFDMPVV